MINATEIMEFFPLLLEASIMDDRDEKIEEESKNCLNF